MYAYLTRLFKNLRELIFDEENLQNIQKAVDILKESDEMEIIEHLFPRIQSKRKEMNDEFTMMFDCCLDTIKNRLF